MGPGSFDPGSRPSTRRPRRLSVASMGPGSFDPGSRLYHAPTLTAPPGFNGAGVFRPRKCALFDALGTALRRLQWGRGLSTPEVAHQETGRHRLFASMGPGSFDPGSQLHCAFHRVTGAELQWGRGLSTPEVCTSFAAAFWAASLQWGRGLSTPEVPSSSLNPLFSSAASMGPGSFDPGSGPGATIAAICSPLQWGRGLSTPEVPLKLSNPLP